MAPVDTFFNQFLQEAFFRSSPEMRSSASARRSSFGAPNKKDVAKERRLSTAP
jgi:hypothetical protein